MIRLIDLIDRSDFFDRELFFQAIEAALLQIEGVSAAVVVVKGEEGDDKYLVAYVVIDNQRNLTRKEIRSSLKVRLPFYMIPSYFVVLPQ